ncbi:transmembrane protein and tail specific protease [Mycoplasmopsis californica]|uniref:S41 family peptidase n=1 Tax=Mycoplasmopsis equigenitalium TaxID=114883 RepID=A0ABY5J318_9BACT|nr:S41 family peptidase [Mycoplasmopsis equigenitalium]UUD36926.1 S41 family peptidase [Mycoplasmopsis equigenitalium]VEU69779.1 transmembrane protein and tail specific protease [Mycoplasmopsis californica]
MMKNKNIKLLIGTAFSVIPLSALSCTTPFHQVDKEINVTSKRYEFYNTTQEYEIDTANVKLYEINDGKTKYVDVEEMINNLDGFFRTHSIHTHKSWFKNELYIWANGSKLILNWKENTIWVSNQDVFGCVHESQVSDFGSNIRYLKTEIEKGEQSVLFNLDKYNLDIVHVKDKILIPLALFSTLFCSTNYYNLYFAGDKVIGAYFLLDENIPNIKEVSQNPLNLTKPTETERRDTLNHLWFTLDYFYGLKNNKSINDFKTFMGPGLSERILSTNPAEFTKAYMDLIYNKLNELHTSPTLLSFYHDPNDKLSKYGTEGSRFIQYKNIKQKLKGLRNKKFPNGVPPIRFYNDMAVISFDSFKIGKVNRHTIKEDTFKLFETAMQKCEENKTIKKVVIDLSLNGGGSVAAMNKTFGFLTNQNVKQSWKDSITDSVMTTTMKIDSDNDGDYKDQDAYTQYEWYVLTSDNTFSAANLFSFLAKYTKVAKLVGKKTGGGMCAVMPVVLVDGTSFQISSNNCIVIHDGDKYIETENGVEPDINLEYDFFYNDAELYKAINK